MIQSLKRTFDILEYIATNGNLVRVNDISQALGLQKTTVHNFLTSLKELGYVEQDELT
ncbi:MAG: MarR family transcriptional regulator, partial [Flavobacterium sp.]